MAEWALKRFWSDACVVEDRHGYRIELDGKPIRTPLKDLLLLPTRAMADAVSAEWDAQTDVIDPRAMPMTRSANSAIDKVARQKAEVEAIVADYGETDLLCYRAPDPAALVERQAEAWDPLLDWAAERYGARLATGTGVLPIAQSSRTLAALSDAVAQTTPFELTALHDLVSLSGSLVLGLAAAERVYPLVDVWKRSRVDEVWQIEQWGEDEEAAEALTIKEEAFHHAFAFFQLAQKNAS
ncbi:ATP12 family chaperone protein [Aestuariibius insulae]|uniref:ATP12 family chaperone protein n=1 Tax=Aestuariibius insulae TaxID=2058287 RepID=UPI00345E08BB